MNVTNVDSKDTGLMLVQSKKVANMEVQDNSQIVRTIKEVSMEVHQFKTEEEIAMVKSKTIQNKNVITAKKVVIGQMHVRNRKKERME